MAGLASFVLLVVVLASWVCDDAYITLRTVDNFVHGRGLVWNVDERVQSYTNPLWMFLVTVPYALSGNDYFALLATSWAVTTAFLGLLSWKGRCHPSGALLALLVLLGSKSFVEFSTSGLENPASHLTVALAWMLALTGEPSPRRLGWVALAASAAALNRLDLVLLTAPAVGVAAVGTARVQSVRSTLLPLLLGSLPLVVWECFSIFYYGAPLPNTAYAKVGTGEPAFSGVAQGARYLHSFALAEPASAVSILAAASLALFRPYRRFAILGLTLVAWCLYQLEIGGDYMVGRYMTPALALAVVPLASIEIPRRWFAGLATVLVVLVVAWPSSPVRAVLAPSSVGTLHYKRGVADEWHAFFHSTGLLAPDGASARAHPFAQAGFEQRRAIEEGDRTAVVSVAIGFHGFFAGPDAVVIDAMGLADPLLARLPVVDLDHLRPGHKLRPVPAGYVETRTTGENRIEDRELARLYDEIRLVVSGDLLNPDRLGAIWRLNTGSWSETVAGYWERLRELGLEGEDPESTHRRMIERAKRRGRL